MFHSNTSTRENQSSFLSNFPERNNRLFENREEDQEDKQREEANPMHQRKPAYMETAQRFVEEEEEEPVQSKTAQRQVEEEEEEMLQPKAIQRQPLEEEEEELQPKSIQRQPLEEEEEELQPKAIQRQELPEEEEELQMKPVQRQPLEEEEEELQPKAIQRQEIPEEEEELQMKPIQRQPLEEEEEELQPKAIQRQEIPEEEEEIQAKTIQKKKKKSVANASTGTRSTLPEKIQAGIFNETGMDTSNVNVHFNSGKPAQINAHAYTQGNDIHVAPNQEKHLGHEAWHVVQQREGRVNSNNSVGGVKINDDSGLENEADVMGSKISSGSTNLNSKGLNGTDNSSNVAQGIFGWGKKKDKKRRHVPKFTSEFGKSDTRKLKRVLTVAYKMVTNAIANIDKDNEKYKTWLDTGTAQSDGADARVTNVKSCFNKIETCLKDDEITLKKYEAGDFWGSIFDYAYVRTNEVQKNIYLGGMFWWARVKGFNSKAGTIIHELTHKLHGTDDHGYGTSKAKKFAKNAPNTAIDNADNLEFFAESSL